MAYCHWRARWKHSKMSSRLDRITDWKRIARKAGYRVRLLAERTGVTERQLERYFRARCAPRPKVWLDHLHMADARRRLRRGMMVKQVAAQFGFKHVQGFTRAFERVFGVAPSESHILGSAYRQPKSLAPPLFASPGKERTRHEVRCGASRRQAGSVSPAATLRESDAACAPHVTVRDSAPRARRAKTAPA